MSGGAEIGCQAHDVAHQRFTSLKSLVLWKMVVDAVLSEPVSGWFSLFYRERTGKNCENNPVVAHLGEFRPESRSVIRVLQGVSLFLD